MSVQVTSKGLIYLVDDLGKNLFCLKEEKKINHSNNTMVIPISAKFKGDDELIYTQIPKGNEAFFKKINKFEPEGNPAMCLLLSEMFFIMKCIPKNEPAVILYIGGHPGDHLNHLALFFQDIHFIIYDYPGDDVKEDQLMVKIGKDPFKSTNDDIVYIKNIDIVREKFSEKTAELYFQKYKSAIQEEHESVKTDEYLEKVKYKNIYLISDIRNRDYNKKKNSDFCIDNSRILDEDTESQLRWCQILKPKSALLKYRPKLASECLTFSELLTINEEKEESKKLYFMYPEGVFIKLPLQKKDQKAMYFICNEYEPKCKYYHHDMISMIEYHHGYTRRAVIYDSPFKSSFGMHDACLSFDYVNKFLDIYVNEKKVNISPEEYCFGCGWDHRAAVHVILTYLSYKGNKKILSSGKYGYSETIKETISRYLIQPYMLMKENEMEKKTET